MSACNQRAAQGGGGGGGRGAAWSGRSNDSRACVCVCVWAGGWGAVRAPPAGPGRRVGVGPVGGWAGGQGGRSVHLSGRCHQQWPATPQLEGSPKHQPPPRPRQATCVEGRGALGGTCLNVGCIPSKAREPDAGGRSLRRCRRRPPLKCAQRPPLSPSHPPPPPPPPDLRTGAVERQPQVSRGQARLCSVRTGGWLGSRAGGTGR